MKATVTLEQEFMRLVALLTCWRRICGDGDERLEPTNTGVQDFQGHGVKSSLWPGLAISSRPAQRSGIRDLRWAATAAGGIRQWRGAPVEPLRRGWPGRWGWR